MSALRPAEGLRVRKKRETRERLLRVARELFAERGFDETTIEVIAEHAGVSKPTVFNYFPAKRDLLTGLVQAADRGFERLVVRAMETEEPTVKRLEQFFSRLANTIETTPDLTRLLMFEAVKSMGMGSDMAVQHSFLLTEKALVRLLKDGMQRGDVREDFQPGLLAQMLLGAYINVVMRWLADPGYKVEPKLKHTARFFGEALLPRE
ncbi:MAG TPA: TetR/AcrR family transcriptional regulator [Spongiibacteraceae bacterium]|nr:TetR/AcrR family transcriptional regulator [Spongiibacteraceae bacterium]HUH37144.1 TetR/AcrR family transcriptional regulator [Spongiibacteraceae bacterium]